MSVALVLVLVTSNVRWAVYSTPLYSFLFDRHHVDQRTGVPSEELRSVGKQLQDYFSSRTGSLSVVARVRGVQRSLFSDREVLHMADVRGLFHLTFRVQEASALFLALAAVAACLRFRRAAWRVVGHWARRGAQLAGALVVAVGLTALLAFGPLFTAFHRIGFRNDFWKLDPRTDFLVMLFPVDFWRDVTLLIGAATLVEAALLFFLGKLLARCFSLPATSCQWTGARP